MLYLLLAILFYLPLQASFPSTTSGCMRIFDGGSQGNGQQVIRIWNGCGEKVFVNACVLTDDGKTKLYQSGRTVPSNGNYTLYTFPFDRPVKVDIAYAPWNPAIPQLCQTGGKGQDSKRLLMRGSTSDPFYISLSTT